MNIFMFMQLDIGVCVTTASLSKRIKPNNMSLQAIMDIKYVIVIAIVDEI